MASMAAAAAMTWCATRGAFAPPTARPRFVEGGVRRAPFRSARMPRASGDNVPGLWYVDEEQQGEHPPT